MERITVAARVENLIDVLDADHGRLAPEAVRSIAVADASVSPRASQLSMPRMLITRLGLPYIRTGKAMTAAGSVEVRVFGPARLTVQGRDCPVDVTELPDGCPVLIGQIPLESMDFVVDLPGRQVIGNPAHGGEQIIELY